MTDAASSRGCERRVASVLFSVLPATTVSGSFRPSAVTPSAPTNVWPAKPEPSMNTISQRSSSIRRDISACSRAPVAATKRRDTLEREVLDDPCAVASRSAPCPRPNSAPDTATKHAIHGLTKATSLDGRPYGIACGQIDIGNAATEMTAPMAKGVPQANGSIEAEPTMDVDNVARAIVYMAGLPLDANVQFMTVMATKMPFVGRG